MEGQQQTISSLKGVPDEAIQFQHIILALEVAILFTMENVNGLNILENTFLNTM